MRALLLAVLLAGCATDPYMTQAQQDQIDDYRCAQRGAPVGSSDYAACRNALTVERAALMQQEAANRASFAARLQSAAQTLQRSQPAQQSDLPDAGGVATTCFSRGEQTSGFNKICYYDCLGSPAAITRASTDLCPLTIRR